MTENSNKWKCNDDDLSEIKVPNYLAEYLINYAYELDRGKRDDDVQILIRDNKINALQNEIELLRTQLKDENPDKFIDVTGITPIPCSKGYALPMCDLVAKGYTFTPEHYNNSLYLR